MRIRTRKKGNHTYYELYEDHRFVKHIGGVDDLNVFRRDVQLGKQAIEHLQKRPYLAPRACLSIIAEGKKTDVGKIGRPTKPYKTIIVDPPWPIEKILRDERPNQSEFDYPTMTIDEIRVLPIKQVADEDGCHVYLWTTQKYLPVAYELFRDWDIEYQCLLTWVKNVGFTPFSFMYSTEHCLFGRYGSLPLLKLGRRLDFEAKVREHSRKPDEFYELVREVSPKPRLDWFSREPREGFEQYGNETSKFSPNTI